MELTVDCKTRASEEKANTLRHQGWIPAVLYGHQGAESLDLAVDAKTVETLLKKASLNNTVIQLNISGSSWKGKTLLREVQSHPSRGIVYHLSFFAIGSHASLNVSVPLHFVGTAIGVKNSGGVLDPIITSLELQCPPDKIPDTIDVDVSNLDVGASLHLREVNLPDGVTTQGDPEQVVATVVPGQRQTGAEDASAPTA